MILDACKLMSYFADFNKNDVKPDSQWISNADAGFWASENIPFFDCPDKEIEEIYYFRWWTYRKHLKKTADGFVVTQFLPDVAWARKYNTINTSQHFSEGRWIHDPGYLDDYTFFWFRKGGDPKFYSFWPAYESYARYLVNLDHTLIVALLPDFISNFKAWAAEGPRGHGGRLLDNGLYWQIDSWDGMEFSIGGSGARPSINSYLYGDAAAIACIAELAGKSDTAGEFRQKAAKIKSGVQNLLWDQEAHFFKTRAYAKAKGDYGNDPLYPDDSLVDVREQIGFTPWYFNLPDAGYEAAWKQLMDPEGFYAPFGPTTAEIRHPGFTVAPGGCVWNGRSWPYATSITLAAMANLLNHYQQDFVDKNDYFTLLKIYARSHHLKRADGSVIPWIDEDLDPFTGEWMTRSYLRSLPEVSKADGGRERGKDYNHSSFCDLIITGLAGFRPRADDILEINPLIPDDWDYFCLDHLLYHGQLITVLFDRTGRHYGRGAGLQVFADGRPARAANLPDFL